MTSTETAPLARLGATCPLCHTVNGTITPEALAAGAMWRCARCGQAWTAQRLETVAAYARFAALHASHR